MQPTLARLAQLAHGRVEGDDNVIPAGVQHDSRAVEVGEMFVALPGANVDGHDFVQQACARGASALMVQRSVEAPVPVLYVDDSRKRLGAVAEEIYGNPTRHLRTVGITGTNGKTTVAWLVEQMLSHLGGKPAVLGTLRAFPGDSPEAATHTTPEADDVARFAREVKKRGGDALVMEASSHALDMHRIDGVQFDVAAFTNLSQDHLDYHESMEAYAEAKARLFGDLAPARSVLNVDDAFGRELRSRITDPICVSARGAQQAVFTAGTVEMHRGGFVTELHTPWGIVPADVPLVGFHNLENLLVALAIAYALELEVEKLTEPAFLSSLRGAPGRMQRVEHPDDVLLYVDYAHTPDALARALEAARGVTDGRLWVVFGCGGDRDRLKRPKMAQVAEQGADEVIVTSDNPRTEDPSAIIDEVCAGLVDKRERTHVEVDRRAAIRYAVKHAKRGDTVLVAGKGHEDYQILGTTRVHLSDVEELHAAVAERSGKGAST